MSTSIERDSTRQLVPTDAPAKRRPDWRQALVDAECGFKLGFRIDSTFYVHFFLTSIVLATAVVLGIGLLQWMLLVLALTMVLSAEMFNQVLKALWNSVGHFLPTSSQNVLRISSAAVLLTTVGAAIVVTMIFAQRLMELFSG